VLRLRYYCSFRKYCLLNKNNNVWLSDSETCLHVYSTGVVAARPAAAAAAAATTLLLLQQQLLL